MDENHHDLWAGWKDDRMAAVWRTAQYWSMTSSSTGDCSDVLPIYGILFHLSGVRFAGSAVHISIYLTGVMRKDGVSKHAHTQRLELLPSYLV